MFKWIFLVFSIIIILEALSRILHNLYLEFHENYNEELIKRIEKYTCILTENNKAMYEPGWSVTDFKRKILTPYIVQQRFINFLENQNDMHWRTVSSWALEMILKTRMQKIIYLKNKIKQYGKKNVTP